MFNTLQTSALAAYNNASILAAPAPDGGAEGEGGAPAGGNGIPNPTPVLPEQMSIINDGLNWLLGIGIVAFVGSIIFLGILIFTSVFRDHNGQIGKKALYIAIGGIVMGSAASIAALVLA